MSDLHLEVGQQYAEYEITPKAPFLILAGDIGRLKDYQPYLDFLRRQCNQFTTVFLVLGNHEFFGSSRAEGLRLASSLEKEPGCVGKLFVMNKLRVDLDPSLEITILGCTLHSKIPPDDRLMVQMKVSDFKHIDAWSVADHNSEHQRDVEWLQKEVKNVRSEKRPEHRILVVTHHAPKIKGTSQPKDVGNPWSSAFATDLLGERVFANVRYWVFGHTHFTTEFSEGPIRLVSNQRGYVLNGGASEKQARKATTHSAIPQLLKSAGSNHHAFDGGKVIEI